MVRAHSLLMSLSDPNNIGWFALLEALIMKLGVDQGAE